MAEQSDSSDPFDPNLFPSLDVDKFDYNGTIWEDYYDALHVCKISELEAENLHPDVRRMITTCNSAQVSSSLREEKNGKSVFLLTH